jgi:hypothetical protein
MKTFEERYTAWIDGRLEGGALSAFEQELARRAAAAEAQADKADASRLRLLLRENLQAPALTNGEFFSLQVRERIEAERAASHRREPAERPSWLGWFAGPVTRLVGLGAAALFVAGALYYGMMPLHNATPPETAALRTAPAARNAASGASGPAAEVPAVAAAPNAERRARSGDDLMAKNDTPAPEDIDDESPGFAARVPDPSTTSATATPLHYRDANVNVLWINGLDYMPNVPDSQPAAPPAAPPAVGSAAPHHG